MKFILTKSEIDVIVTSHMETKFGVTVKSITSKDSNSLISNLQIQIEGTQEIDKINLKDRPETERALRGDSFDVDSFITECYCASCSRARSGQSSL